jgi:hypothetical protein
LREADESLLARLNALSVGAVDGAAVEVMEVSNGRIV